MLCDAALTLLTFVAASVLYDLTHDVGLSLTTFTKLRGYFYVLLPITLASFICFGLYTRLWKYAGVSDYIYIACAESVTFAINIFLINFVPQLKGLSIAPSVIIYQSVIMLAATVFSRMIPKIANSLELKAQKRREGKAAAGNTNQRIMIIGAGSATQLLLGEFKINGRLSEVKCIIDDNKSKIGGNIMGIFVVGDRFYINEAVAKYAINEIIFAIPSMPNTAKLEIIEICKRACKNVKTLPNITEILGDDVKLNHLKEINVEELLGRDPIRTDLTRMMEYVTDKVILVTGGGGSIGSELCRQIAMYRPKKLIILDIYENNAYNIQQELSRKYPDLDVTAEIVSVRDEIATTAVFEKYRPNIVYHAAAHKHVPLMEHNPEEAIKNNVFGTYKTAKAAIKSGVERFVMISTDKAVNPTNVMGATKRICEMIVQMMNGRSKTEFVAVRFGNVLGSNGSVIPLFLKQIEEGGPVTVTHPDIIRYFMTIPEAVSLVLQAGALAKGGEIFVLDMGKPVKIVELAENVIRLSGHVPYTEIGIDFTGLRPGEKLYEELLMSEEGLVKTQSDRIFVGKPIDFDETELEKKLGALSDALYDGTSDVRSLIADIVPTYTYKKEEYETDKTVSV